MGEQFTGQVWNRMATGIAVLLATFCPAFANADTPTNGDELIFRSIEGDSHVIHKYTTVGSSTFIPPDGVEAVEYLIVAGGGAGGWRGGDNSGGGGGGAGGLLTNVGDTPFAVTGGSTFSVVVGAGGVPQSQAPGQDGGDSSVFGQTAIGGGGGGYWNPGARDGGSGGGASGRGSFGGTQFGGKGTEAQGHDGGDRTATGNYGGAGGGGAGAFGENNTNNVDGRVGGSGVQNSITGEAIDYAGGGGGGAALNGNPGLGGLGGGGAGHSAGTDGLGGGGGGGSYQGTNRAQAGGSGIVVVRYRLEDVASWDDHGYYALPNGGAARNILIDDSVALRIGAGHGFSILPSGTFSVGNGGSLVVQGTLNIGAGAVVLSGGTAVLNISGTAAESQSIGSLAGVAGAAFVLGNKNLNVGGDNTSTSFGGGISGIGGSLTKSGVGTLTLSGNNTYTGGTLVSAGTLMLDRAGAPALTGNVVVDGGSLRFAPGCTPNQIADDASITVLSGHLNSTDGGDVGRRGHRETLANLAILGGTFQTGRSGAASWTITGDGVVTGGAGAKVRVNELSAISFGSLTLTDLTSTTMYSNNSFSIYGNRENEATLHVGAGGLMLHNSRILVRKGDIADHVGVALILDGDVTATGTSAIQIVSPDGYPYGAADLRLSSTAGTFTRTFNVEGGGSHLLIEVDVTDGAADTANIVKSGPGTLTLTGTNTYTGTTTVLAGTLEVTGSLVGNGSADVRVGSAGTTFDGAEPSIVRRVGDEASFAGFGSQIVGEPRLAGFHTEAELLAGTNNSDGALDVGMAWRMFGGGEAQGTAPYLRPVSDVLRLTGMAEDSEPTNPFVLQMSYDASLVGPGTEGGLHLAWLDGTEWVNAVAGNFGAGAEVVERYWGSWDDFATEYGSDLNVRLGSWGVDTGSAVVWALLDHNSQFGILVPEPGSVVLLMFGVLGLLVFGQRRFRI